MSPTSDQLTSYRTRAIGARAELVLPGEFVVPAAGLLDRELERVDRLASRFRADSEVVTLYRAGGRPTRVSSGLLELICVALTAAEATDGAVDPTVGAAMCRLGYDRDFPLVQRGVDGSLPSARPVPGWRGIDVDVESSTVTTPAGALLDLGATAKALTADRVAAAVHWHYGCPVLVSLGGDIAIAGSGGDRFAVGLGEVSGVPDGTGTISLGPGGLATSGVGTRRWTLGGIPVHHIVDPATGLPARVVWRTVTVGAASCVDANTASTAAMVKADAAPDWLDGQGLPARLVDGEGKVTRTGHWPADLGQPLGVLGHPVGACRARQEEDSAS